MKPLGKLFLEWEQSRRLGVYVREAVGSKVCLEGVIRLLDQIKSYPFANFSLWQILANLAQVKQS